MIVKSADYAFLPTCLRNVRSEVDEAIVVVDQLDEEIEKLAAEFSLRLVEHPWPGSFAEQRNVSLGYATQPWILVLDADEVIAAEDVRTLKKLITSDRYQAVEMVQWNYTNDSHQERFVFVENDIARKFGWKGYFPVPCIRAFRSLPEIRFSRRVHEMIDLTVPQDRILRTGLIIHHLKALKGADALKASEVRYLDLIEKELADSPTAKAWFDRGTIYLFTLNNPQEAVISFTNALSIHPQFSEAKLNLAVAYGLLGKWEDALAQYDGVERSPSVDVNRAVCLVKLGRREESRALLNEAERRFPGQKDVFRLAREQLSL